MDNSGWLCGFGSIGSDDRLYVGEKSEEINMV